MRHRQRDRQKDGLNFITILSSCGLNQAKECTILLFELEQSLDGRAREGEAGSSGEKKKKIQVWAELWFLTKPDYLNRQKRQL